MVKRKFQKEEAPKKLKKFFVRLSNGKTKVVEAENIKALYKQI